MKSRITIEIDHDNQPIIQIQYEESPDVRDKLVKRFLESFGGSSCWATFYFSQNSEYGDISASIRPIHPTNLPEAVKPMIAEAAKHEKIQKVLEDQFPGVMK